MALIQRLLSDKWVAIVVSQLHDYCFECLTHIEDRGQGEFTCKCGKKASPQQVSSDAETLRAGTILHKGKYLLGKMLGKGGFGRTYLALDTTLGFRVAIKEYYPSGLCSRVREGNKVEPLSTDPNNVKSFNLGLEKFLEEGRSLARFKGHPNIVSVENFFRENGTGYLVMAYLEGGTLRKRMLSEGGYLTWEQAVKHILGACDGLEEVHKRKMLHRDIKPDNLFVVESGSGSSYRQHTILLDFGAARGFLASNSSCSIIFTPGFTPLEQLLGEGTQGPWTDIYALGATFYNLLAGKHPPEINIRTKSVHIPHISTVSKTPVPDHISDAVMRSLELMYEDRFQTIEEFRQAILPEAPKRIPKPRPTPALREGQQLALAALSGQYQGGLFPLSPDRDLVIGRDPTRCNIVFDPDTPAISRVHLIMRAIRGAPSVQIMDPGSSCGTWIDSNGPITARRWYEVGPQQILSLGSYDIQFQVVPV